MPPLHPAARGGTYVRGSMNLRNTTICCAFFRAGFYSSETSGSNFFFIFIWEAPCADIFSDL